MRVPAELYQMETTLAQQFPAVRLRAWAVGAPAPDRGDAHCTLLVDQRGSNAMDRVGESILHTAP